MLVNFGVTVFTILVFLFIFWKRLKEDYSSEIIFKVSIYILAGCTIGFLISNKFFPNWFFWMSLAGAALGLTASFLTLKVKFYETLDALIIASLPILATIFLFNSVNKSSFTSFIGFVAILVFIFIFYFLDTHYKKFNWYKSGKVGFAGIATAVLFFLTRFVVATLHTPVLSFVGRSELIVSGMLSVVCAVLLFDLGRDK